MITWREFAEVAFQRSISSSSSTSSSTTFQSGGGTNTSSFSSSQAASELFIGAYHYSTSSSGSTRGSTNSSGISQTVTATGQQTTFSTTFNAETSTTISLEIGSVRTQSTTEQYIFVTTTSTVATTGNETQEDWTTTHETSTRSSVARSNYPAQKEFVVSTTLAGIVAANYWNTVYQANRGSVLYVAPRVELFSWDGQGQTLNTTTRTTISAETATLSIATVNTASAAQSLTNPSASSSLSWKTTEYYTTQITSADLLVLPHSTFATEIEKNDLTTTSGATDSRAESTLIHRANTYTRRLAYVARKTLSRFAETVSFATTYFDLSVSTNTTLHTATFTTASTQASGANSASGLSAGANGAFSTISQIPLCGIKSPGNAVGWFVYGRAGASDSSSEGLFYPITDSLSFVQQAHTRYPAGLVTIFPKTNDSYTANGTGLTWTTTTAGSESFTTKSSAIVVQGEAITTLLTSRQGVLGGSLGESETAVQLIGRGVYKNETGGTSFFQGHATSYSVSSITGFWSPVHWLGESGPFVSEVPRNSNLLPDFVDAVFIYPQEHF